MHSSYSPGHSAGGCRNNLALFATNPQYLLTVFDEDTSDRGSSESSSSSDEDGGGAGSKGRITYDVSRGLGGTSLNVRLHEFADKGRKYKCQIVCGHHILLGADRYGRPW